MASSDTDSATEDWAALPVCSPPRKRSKKGHLSIQEKEIILNVYRKEINYYNTLPVDQVVKIVAKSTGVCATTVYKIIKEYKHGHTLVGPKENRSRPKLLDSVDDFDQHAIRRKVHEFYFRNEIPTIDKVLEVVNSDEHLPTFKRTTFYKLLQKLSFKYVGRGRNSMLVDRDEIIVWRREYLQCVKSYRGQGRKIYYMDETWINAAHTKKKCWMDETVTSSRQAFLAGLSTGLKNPSGKGKRLIICHIGSEDGFVPDGLWIFESKKSGDYHEEMNGESFEKWFSKILPKLEENSVIVMDNASYHSRKIEKIPTSTTKKAEIQSWLSSKNIAFDKNLLKPQLLALVDSEKHKYKGHIIDEMAKSCNKTVLRLPPYHCELNPIELIWAQIKNYVACHNTTFKFADLKKLFCDALNTINSEKWKKCIQHVRDKVEVKMWELDNIIEAKIEPIIISINNSDTSDFSD